MHVVIHGLATALVTGGSRGIGRAIADRLASSGLDVHVVASGSASLSALADHRITGHEIDVRDRSAMSTLVADIDVDVLINNAGVIGDFSSFPDTDPATIDALIDVNLKAAIHLTRLVVPGMRERGRGHVFFIGSVAGEHPTPKTAVYSATKAAIRSFAEGLRFDLLGSPVRVTVLAPGRVETSLYDQALGGHDRAIEELYSRIEPVQPTDVADLVVTALTAPPHVNVSYLQVMPIGQIYGGNTLAP